MALHPRWNSLGDCTTNEQHVQRCTELHVMYKLNDIVYKLHVQRETGVLPKLATAKGSTLKHAACVDPARKPRLPVSISSYITPTWLRSAQSATAATTTTTTTTTTRTTTTTTTTTIRLRLRLRLLLRLRLGPLSLSLSLQLHKQSVLTEALRTPHRRRTAGDVREKIP